MKSENAMALLKALALQLGILLVTFATIEFGLRVYSSTLFKAPKEIQGKNFTNTNGLMVPNAIPYSGFTLFHNLEITLLNKKLTSNGQGYRTPDFSQKKQKGTVRILGIGDSVMMGQGVSDDEVYLRKLEKKLSACGQIPIEVINLAIAGQSAEQEYHLLKEMISLGPNLIIFGYVGNDWVNEEKVQTRNYFSSGSYALNFIILHTLKALGKLNDRYGNPIDPIEWRPFKRQKRPKSISLSRAYQEMSKLTHKAKATGVVLMDSRYEALEKSHDEMEGFFKRMKLSPINLLKKWHPLPPGLTGTEAVTRDDEHNRKYIIQGDFHPNTIWHHDVAELLYQELKDKVCP